MHKMYLLSCIALTLALVADGAPAASSRKETQQQLEHLLKDLQLLLETVNNYKKHELSSLLTFKFHMPRATELKHLQCLVDELRPLEDVLSIAQSKNSNIKQLVSNINVIAQKLRGPETTYTCDYDDERETVIEFLKKWITFCQSIFSTLI